MNPQNGTPVGGVQDAAPKPISGRKLAKALKAGTVPPGFVPWLAFQLQTGGAYLYSLTAKQSRQVTGAKCAELAAERRKHRPTNGNGHRVLFRRDLTDSDVDAIIGQVGPDKVMQALDRLTKPRCERTSDMFPITR